MGLINSLSNVHIGFSGESLISTGKSYPGHAAFVPIDDPDRILSEIPVVEPNSGASGLASDPLGE